MITFNGCFLSGGLFWQVLGSALDSDSVLCIRFSIYGEDRRRDLLRGIHQALQHSGDIWLRQAGESWVLDLSLLRQRMEEHIGQLTWLQGTLVVKPELSLERRPYLDARLGEQIRTLVCFYVYEEDIRMIQQRKIFLSHKGVDKPIVRRCFELLKTLGFEPWLDEDAMPAGAELNRAILRGFHDSCAAVFFVTPAFKDEKFLRSEVNYAIQQKQERAERFAIVTLLLPDVQGRVGDVPELLRPYVWKRVESELQAFVEILRAIPLTVGPVEWRDNFGQLSAMGD